MADAGGDKTSLQFTPTWEVALVCFIMVSISIIVEGFCRCIGQHMKKKIEWLHLGALQKIKDELMLLGFISLLLAVFQSGIGKICVSKQLSNIWLPCKKPNSSSFVANFTTSSFPSSGTQGRRLLTVASNATDYCSQKGKVAFLSVEAVHQLHIFIFALAISHVVLCPLKLSMIIQWEFSKMYEARIIALSKSKQSYKNTSGFFVSMGLFMLKGIALMSPDQYIALRNNFRVACNPEDPGKEFQKYIMRTLQKEFQKIIGIRWYFWLSVVTFLLLNVAGWHALFWISFTPLIFLVVVHFKLEHMIGQQVKAVAKRLTQSNEKSSKNIAEGMVIEILDSDFLFGRPHLVGTLIHFVLFKNSLQLTFFFFILFQFGFHSCIMGKVGFVVPRIVIGFFVHLLCTCRTIPLYAIMKSQMRLKEKQLDEQKIEKIMILLKENALDEHIKECLCDLDEIKMHLKKQSDKQKIEKIKMLLKENPSERIKECLRNLDEIKMHLKESDQQNIEKVKMLLKENESECIKKCLRDLNKIKKRLEEDEMDEEKEMWIASCILNWIEGISKWIYKGISKWISEGISKWIDIAISKWIDRGNKPSSQEEARNIEPTRTGSREASVGVEITESTDMNSAGDIEAQNR